MAQLTEGDGRHWHKGGCIKAKHLLSKAMQKEVSKALLRKTFDPNNWSFLFWSIFIQLHHLATA